ncbi:MAG: LCP family protein [Propionibacteriaceae bacterium]|jgi:LCP family protein required for cell wall assembly|nr:LCP family protein [Propionibacteriaceae bacterium]
MSEPARRAAWTPQPVDSPSEVRPRRARHHKTRQRVRGVGFGGALGWTALGTLVPGVGLLRAGKRVSGLLALIAVIFALGSLAYLYLDRSTALRFVTNATVMRWVALGLVVLGAAWTALTVVTYWSLAPRDLSSPKRSTAALIVGLFTFAVTAPTLVAAQYSVSSAQALGSIFGGGNLSGTTPTFAPSELKDPWATKERLNILFLGFDTGLGRTAEEGYGELTDTIMLASIDTQTGNTVLVSIPRDTENMPFPKDSPLYQRYPSGWYDKANSIYTLVPMEVDDDILGPTSNLGADAIKLSVGAALGVTVDYYVLINIDGATDLIDAIGGIRVNINKSIPKGDPDLGLGFFKVGPNQWLDGEDALLYARSRKYDDDFQRGGRQRCVVKAIVDQADFTTFLTRFEAIAAAGSELITTDIPATLLPAMFDLALRVKNEGTMTGLGFQDGDYGFDVTNPNFKMMAQRTAEAIEESVNGPAATAAATGDPSGLGEGEVTPSGTETATTPSASADVDLSVSDTADLDDFCAYHPE